MFSPNRKTFIDSISKYSFPFGPTVEIFIFPNEAEGDNKVLIFFSIYDSNLNRSCEDCFLFLFLFFLQCHIALATKVTLFVLITNELGLNRNLRLKFQHR